MSSNKKSVKFTLVPRPQRDPLAADFEAPQHVLIPKGGVDIEEVKNKFPGIDPIVFPSQNEERVGMLERAHQGQGLTLDSDILRAMSKDFDYNDPQNIIDDDFMDQAGGLIEDEGEIPDDLFDDEPEIIRFDKGYDNQDDEDFDEDDDMDVRSQDNRTFTNYSMTSSVMRRSQGLQQIDEHFERLFEEQYADDTEIGALDLVEVQGEKVLTDMEELRQMNKEVKSLRKKDHKDDYEPVIVSDHHKNAIIGDDSSDEDLVEVEVQRRENRVDCESILSYNSNLYNHPKLIVEPRRKTTSRCSDVTMSEAPSRAQSVASSRATIISKISTRNPDETPEERRARKKLVKTYRHERRQEKKQNTQIFKREQAHLVKQQAKNIAALKLV